MSRPMNKWQLIRRDEEFIENGLTPLLSLPDEMRELIIQNVGQKSALILRRVCRQLQIDVDKFFPFRVQFKESNPVVPWLSCLRVHDCGIIAPKESATFQTIQNLQLMYPRAVRHFRATHSGFRNNNINAGQPIPSVCPEIYTDVLRSCSQHVKQISLALDFRVLDHQFPVGMTFKFTNLALLDVSVHIPKEATTLSTKNNGLFDIILNQSCTLNLRSIRIELKMTSGNNVMDFLGTVLQCLAKPRKIPLKTFYLLLSRHLLEFAQVQLARILSRDECHRFYQINQLQKLRMEFFSLVTDEDDCWQKLILNQRQLVFLSLTTLINIPCKLVNSIILHNTETLVKLVLGLVEHPLDEHGFQTPFDCSIFQKCHKLKILKLASTLDHIPNSQTSLVHLNLLPNRLQELSLAHFNVNTAELLALGQASCSQIKSIRVTYGGTHGLVGVTGTVIHQFMSRENVMQLQFKKLNVSDMAENSIVDAIVEQYGIPRMLHNMNQNFQLSRNPTTMLWHSWQ